MDDHDLNRVDKVGGFMVDLQELRVLAVGDQW